MTYRLNPPRGKFSDSVIFGSSHSLAPLFLQLCLQTKMTKRLIECKEKEKSRYSLISFLCESTEPAIVNPRNVTGVSWSLFYFYFCLLMNCFHPPLFWSIILPKPQITSTTLFGLCNTKTKERDTKNPFFK